MARPLAKLVALITPKRRWAQFSLATAMVVVTVICMWLAVVVNRAHRQRDAVAAIEALGGFVVYADHDESRAEIFLRRWLARDYFEEVHRVWLERTDVADCDLVHLQMLAGLRVLQLSKTHRITDAGLTHLRGLTRLQELSLSDTLVTDAGLNHLQRLTTLEELYLDGAQVTDAGLNHLLGMTQLQVLWLEGTQVSDAGLKNLCGLNRLHELWLGPPVTDAGVAELQKDLPNCKIIILD